MRFLFLPFLLAPGLAACDPVTGLMLDGVSLVVTGKTVSDNAISVVADQDCSLSRSLQGFDICNTHGTPEATDEPRHRPSSVRSAPALLAAEDEDEDADEDEDEDEDGAVGVRNIAYTLPSPPSIPTSIYYFLVGVYGNEAAADRAAVAYADLKSSVVEFRVEGRRYYRVIAGPLDSDEHAEATRRHAGVPASVPDLPR